MCLQHMVLSVDQESEEKDLLDQTHSRRAGGQSVEEKVNTENLVE